MLSSFIEDCLEEETLLDEAGEFSFIGFLVLLPSVWNETSPSLINYLWLSGRLYALIYWRGYGWEMDSVANVWRGNLGAS